MNNRKDFIGLNTRGQTANHSRAKGVEVRPQNPPMKTTGEDPNESARAKASPKFKEIKPSAKASKEEEREAIDQNTELEIKTDETQND